MKKVLVTCGLLFSLSGWGQTLPYQNPELSPAERAKDLVKRLTLEEKALLMCDDSEAIPRLGIKKFNWWSEALHGVANQGNVTVFPEPVGMAASFNDKLVFDIFNAVSDEMRAKHNERVRNGLEDVRFHSLSVWTPNVNIFRDPRWGRVSEGNGEDSFLGAEIARAMVRGYQGKDMSSNDEIMACVKHFALYGASEAGRDYNTVDMSHQRMFNEYMLPYQAAVEEGVGSVMASFNEVDGVPATGNKWLMTDVLRKQWNFDGFVVTDYTGITEMTDHGMGDTQTVAALALNAGVDMDMVSDAFTSTLKKSLEEGKVSVKAVDAACRRILEAKYKLGLFDNPYKYCDITRPKKQIFTKEHRAIARKTASESFVLLKNENGVLPLAKKGTIAVVGPLADSRSNMPGTWSVAAVMNKYPSLIEGLKEVVGGKAKILTAKGSNLMSDAEYEERATMFGRTLHRDNRTDKELLDEALAVAAKSDVIVAALGESSEMSGESSCRTDLEMPDTQRALLQELLKTGKPMVLVLFTGRPLVLNWEQENVPAILNVWFGGSEAALAIGDVLFGNVNPSGKLTATFPKSVGQIPLFYNHKNTGRPLPQGAWFQKFRSNYLDVDNEPLYPFGYGLSYTTFSYSDITLDKSSMNINGEITATVTVTNTGKYDGSEVVQLYIRDLIGSVTRPVKELKGFEKIFLKAGESKQVSFKLTADMLKFYNYNLDFVCEPGDFEVMIGGDSRDVNKALFSLQ